MPDTADYLLYDRCIRIASHAGFLTSAADFVLESVGASKLDEGVRSADLFLELKSSSFVAEPPPSARLHVELTHHIRVLEETGRIYLHHPDGLLLLDRSAGIAKGTFSTRDEFLGAPALLLLTFGLALLLRQYGLFAIHGACAVHPERGAYLIIGPSGSGKSTLTYSLVRSGWSFLSDDSLVLKKSESHVDVMPFRRHFYVDDATTDIFEELLTVDKQRSEFNEDKWRIDVDRLQGGKMVSTCKPRVLLFSSISARCISEARAISKKDALLRLLPQAGIILDPDREAGRRYLDVLSQLAEQTLTFQLELGRDLLRDPSEAATVLSGL